MDKKNTNKGRPPFIAAAFAGMAEAEQPEYVRAIKPNYQKIRAFYLYICSAGAFVVLLFQIVLYVIFKLELLPIYFMTSELVHLLKYLIIPSVLNFGTLLIAWQINKKYRGNEFLLNLSPVLAMCVICSVTASAHSVYSVTIMLLCLPILMVSIFGQPKMLYATTGVCLVGFVSATICRIVSPYRQNPMDTKLIPETVAAFVFIAIAAAISLIMINLLEVQKSRLISATRNAEIARRQAQAASEAKSDFLVNMSHELRTPLNAVVGLTEMITRKTSEPEIREYDVDIQQAGNLLLAIINDILDISKIESGKMEIKEAKYELGSLINDSYNMVALRIQEKGLTAAVTCDPELPRLLYGDEYHLRQVLVNLLTNAVKYTNDGSIELNVSGEENGDILKLEVRIKDTGIGIREEDMPNLFEKFTRLELSRNRRIEGTGLGLSITKKLVELMNGTIAVESVYGEGSTFIVRVPQKIADRTPIGDIHSSYLDMLGEFEQYHQSFEAPDARILVVDDVPVNLLVIRKLLEPTKLKVDTADSGHECLEMVCRERYDLILMDHMMPEMDGIETLLAMKQLDSSKNIGVPVVMLTANAMAGVRDEYLDKGFIDYLSKPVRGARLENTILKYIPAEKILKPAEGSAAVSGADAAAHDLKTLLPELDTVSGLAYCAGDAEFYHSMLKDFASAGWSERLESAFAAGDWESCQIDAHTMKSSARMVGLPALSDECYALEQAAKNRDKAQIERAHKVLTEHYNRVRDSIMTQ